MSDHTEPINIDLTVPSDEGNEENQPNNTQDNRAQAGPSRRPGHASVTENPRIPRVDQMRGNGLLNRPGRRLGKRQINWTFEEDMALIMLMLFCDRLSQGGGLRDFEVYQRLPYFRRGTVQAMWSRFNKYIKRKERYSLEKLVKRFDQRPEVVEMIRERINGYEDHAAEVDLPADWPPLSYDRLIQAKLNQL